MRKQDSSQNKEDRTQDIGGSKKAQRRMEREEGRKKT